MEKDKEKTKVPTLAEQVKKVLLDAEEPLRAVDIVKALAELEPPVTASTSEVNKVLYRDTFEKASDKGKPTWRVKPVPVVHPRPEGMQTFAVPEIAIVSIPVRMPPATIEALLASLHRIGAELVQIGGGTGHEFRAEPSPEGEALAAIATRVGFKVGKPLDGQLK